MLAAGVDVGMIERFAQNLPPRVEMAKRGAFAWGVFVFKKPEVPKPKNAAFVFVKPHAVTDKVVGLVKGYFTGKGIKVLGEGSIKAEEVRRGGRDDIGREE